MNRVEMLVPSQLRRYSELVGGRKLRDFEYYHWLKYDTAGHYNLKFFMVDGEQTDMSGASGTILNVSNMVQSGKFDEPFIITGISVGFIPEASTKLNQIIDVLDVVPSGRIIMEVNKSQVFERAPISRCGSPINFVGVSSVIGAGTACGFVSSGIKPHRLNPFIYCAEGVSIRVVMEWSTLVTVTTDSWVGVYLHGGKYFKA